MIFFPCPIWSLSCFLAKVSYPLFLLDLVFNFYTTLNIQHIENFITFFTVYELYPVSCLKCRISCHFFHVTCLMWSVPYHLLYVTCSQSFYLSFRSMCSGPYPSYRERGIGKIKIFYEILVNFSLLFQATNSAQLRLSHSDYEIISINGRRRAGYTKISCIKYK